MENMKYEQTDDRVIDLKELLFFILRKWRVWLFAGVIGLVIGMGLGLIIPEKSIDDPDMEEIHIEEIEQYTRYRQQYDLYYQLYEKQKEQAADSVYMNMDPEAVYSGSRIYFISANNSNMSRIREMYASIYRDERIYDDLIAASGLACSQSAIEELASVSFEKSELEENDFFSDKQERSALVKIHIHAPTQESCIGMLDLLDARVQAVNDEVLGKYQEASCELIADYCTLGYDSGVVDKRNKAAELMGRYMTEMAALEKMLPDDNKLYYEEVSGTQLAEGVSLNWLKWGLVLGILLGGAAVVFYGGLFLMDDHVKNLEEIKRYYGLHVLACMNGGKQEKRKCAIDRLLAPKLKYNHAAYLRSAIAAMDMKSIHVCGNMENEQLAAQMRAIAEADGVSVSDALSVDETAQMQAKAADGIVLYVQLWNTKHAELLRELEIARHLNVRVLGVVALD